MVHCGRRAHVVVHKTVKFSYKMFQIDLKFNTRVSQKLLRIVEDDYCA